MHNSRALIEDALAGVRPSRTPVFDLLANDAVIGHFAGTPLDGSNDEHVVTLAAANALDGTRSIAVPGSEQVSWIDAVGNTRITDRWTSWLKTSAYSGSEEWSKWLRAYIEGYEQGPESTALLDLTESEVSRGRQDSVLVQQRDYNRGLGGTVAIHCTPSTAINALHYFLGLETLSYLWYDYRDLIQQWIGVYRDLTVNYIETTAHSETSPIAMIYSDIAYNNGPMFSDEMFREMGFYDEIEEICQRCHDRGLQVIFHSDGNFMSILDNLVNTGINGINPIEKAAGMDIFEIRRKYPALTLVGGVDVTHLLRTASVEKISRQTKRIIAETGSEGHLLIGSSTEVGNDIPLDKYLAFHDEVMKG